VIVAFLKQQGWNIDDLLEKKRHDVVQVVGG